MNAIKQGTFAGVIGWPVGHSLSPQLHGYWLREHNIDGAYVLLPVMPEDFSAALAGLSKAGCVGVNVTVPHKEAAFAVADELDEAALAAGAVNLLSFREDRFAGRNTDVQGLAASLEEGLGTNSLSGGTATVLGTGGAARAAILACDRIHAGLIQIIGRRITQAEALIASLKRHVRAGIAAFAWDDWPEAAMKTRLLINATSAGMKGATPLVLSLDPLMQDASVCDLVYNPLDTDLLKLARARGHRTIDGLGMLMHQAIPAFEAFYGVRPCVSPALRSTLERVLRHAG